MYLNWDVISHDTKALIARRTKDEELMILVCMSRNKGRSSTGSFQDLSTCFLSRLFTPLSPHGHQPPGDLASAAGCSTACAGGTDASWIPNKTRSRGRKSRSGDNSSALGAMAVFEST